MMTMCVFAEKIYKVNSIKMKITHVITLIIAIVLIAGCVKNTTDTSGSDNVYLDTSQTADERAADLVSRMTLEEKISQIGNRTPAIERLNIEACDYWNEALHGVARAGLATVFPQVIGLSSTWDPDLIFDIATVTSDEARIKNNITGKGLTYWSPTVNMSRDPRWGRAEESYGEDPYLASRLSVEFVRGMQGDDPDYLKTVATLKHYAANNTEFDRHHSSSVVDLRDLLEYYLPVFEAGVVEGKAHSVMSAYNALNGIPASANHLLLEDILRDRWGFDGFVVTDCGAIYDMYANHNFTETPEEAVALAIKAGADLNCSLDYGFSPRTNVHSPDSELGTDSFYGMYQQFGMKAIERGLMTEDDVDVVLHRIMRGRILLGDFDPSDQVPYKQIPESQLDAPEHRELVLEAARKSLVLLKNENNTLPLNKDEIKTIAVLGPLGDRLVYGGYSGTPSDPVTPLRAISERFGVPYQTTREVVDMTEYAEMEGMRLDPNQMGFLSYVENNSYVSYENVEFDNETIFELRAASGSAGGKVTVTLNSLDGPVLAVIDVPNTGGWQSWRSFSSPIEQLSGEYDLYLTFTGRDAYSMNVQGMGFPAEQDADNDAVLYANGVGITGEKHQSELDEALYYAQKADVTLVVVGTDLSIADEGYDRQDLDLPGAQKELIKEVLKVNPNTVVVLATGYPLSINWTDENVPAILTAWYGGQSQGTAITEVLFGDYNPGGKLSSTWYKTADDLPEFTDYRIRETDRTYLYFQGETLYPFGYGLSYTDFEYRNLRLSSNDISKGSDITVRADIQNTGSYAGDEVVQLYIREVESSVKRPLKQLAAFERISLKPGEKRTVTLNLPYKGLSFYDEKTGNFIVNEGVFELMVGTSSEEILLRADINATEGIASDTYYGLTEPR